MCDGNVLFSKQWRKGKRIVKNVCLSEKQTIVLEYCDRGYFLALRGRETSRGLGLERKELILTTTTEVVCPYPGRNASNGKFSGHWSIWHAFHLASEEPNACWHFDDN